jgi:GNAT superfamily N-acetyltransferase
MAGGASEHVVLGRNGDVVLLLRGPDCLSLLEPLWLDLFDHHQSIGDAGIRAIDRAQSWPRRRQLYEGLFQDPDTFVVLAIRDDTAVGYAMCHLRRGADDTWDTGHLIGEVETLVVAPTERESSLGTALMDAAERQFARLGANDVMAAVMDGNDRAMEFYRRRGMTPTVTYMMRVRDTGQEAASTT